MQYAQVPRPQSIVPPVPRKRGPPTALRIDTPAQNPLIAFAQSDSSASTTTLSPTTSDSDFPFHPPNRPRSLRNMKKLSLTLPSAQSSSNSLALPPAERRDAVSSAQHEDSLIERPRRPSIISLPNPSINPLLHRKEEDGSPTVPYADGPEQIIPGIWLGSEDNARDWAGLIERGIKSILNVAKEVASPFASAVPQPSRPFVSTPNLRRTAKETSSTYYPANRATGRPGMHYLKLQWSHGEQDLVESGFPAAMAFVDAALQREEGVLIHCQCGISRSATLVIALVMRAAALSSPSVPPEIWALKGMQGAYTFVKDKSKWVSPNMSLIYQLLEYERKLKGASSPASSERSSGVAEEEEEWGRRRQMLDETSEDDDRESVEVLREARALDKAMEDRIVARKSSTSSIASSGVGMGAAWRNRYGGSRKRAASIASNLTTGSILSEELVEEEEEQELLGVGGGFDSRRSSVELEESSTDSQPESDSVVPRALPFTPLTARPPVTARSPPSAPVFRTSFPIAAPPATATRSTFGLPLRPPSLPANGKRRPPPLGILPPVPSSPITVVNAPVRPPRARTESRKPAPPPLHLRSSHASIAFKPNQILPAVATPSQTLFVFPPSPTLTTRTPSTMTLTMSANAVPFPTAGHTPRISTSRSKGRPRSFISLGVSSTPTTACSRVDARGWIGQD